MPPMCIWCIAGFIGAFSVLSSVLFRSSIGGLSGGIISPVASWVILAYSFLPSFLLPFQPFPSLFLFATFSNHIASRANSSYHIHTMFPDRHLQKVGRERQYSAASELVSVPLGSHPDPLLGHLASTQSDAQSFGISGSNTIAPITSIDQSLRSSPSQPRSQCFYLHTHASPQLETPTTFG
jgi:hypothetical protein